MPFSSPDISALRSASSKSANNSTPDTLPVIENMLKSVSDCCLMTRGRRGHDPMVVGYATYYVISAYYH